MIENTLSVLFTCAPAWINNTAADICWFKHAYLNALFDFKTNRHIYIKENFMRKIIKTNIVVVMNYDCSSSQQHANDFVLSLHCCQLQRAQSMLSIQQNRINHTEKEHEIHKHGKMASTQSSTSMQTMIAKIRKNNRSYHQKKTQRMEMWENPEQRNIIWLKSKRCNLQDSFHPYRLQHWSTIQGCVFDHDLKQSSIQSLHTDKWQQIPNAQNSNILSIKNHQQQFLLISLRDSYHWQWLLFWSTIQLFENARYAQQSSMHCLHSGKQQQQHTFY